MVAKKGLGKGLGALFGDADDFLEDFDEPTVDKADKPIEKPVEPIAKPVVTKNDGSNARHIELPIEQIVRNENQPRKSFDSDALNELAGSIRVHGVITPIIVVKIGVEGISAGGDKYMIIAGERRWRAATAAGLKTIPAIVRNYTPRQVKEISLIENIQREDLNPIETALAIKTLMQDYSYTQEQVSERIGKSRSAVANTLGLLSLDKRVIELVSSGRLSAGHAKILHALDNFEMQYEMSLKAADGKMAVRRFEELVRSKRNRENDVERRPEMSLELRDLIGRMQRVLATKVSLIGNDNKGRIYIDYYTKDDLERIFYFIKTIEET